MRKVLTAFIAAISIGAATITTSSSAKAWWGWGPAVAGGVIAGAIVGSTLAAGRTITRITATDRTPIMGPAVTVSGTVTPGYPPASY